VEFRIKHKDNPNTEKYKQEDIDIAYDFSKKVIKEFNTFVKSIVLFGSTVRAEQRSNDIDILIIIDDISLQITPEVIDAYRVIMEKLIAESSRKLHVTTLKMTNFWDYIRKGDPIGLNILRDGVALYDISLFEPLRVLLLQGRIAPSNEVINIYLNKSMGSMFHSKNLLLQATLDLYWGVIDIAHAALMQENVMPATPAHVGDKLEEVFVKDGRLENKYVKIMKNFYHLSKSIIHNIKTSVSGEEYDQYYKEAHLFIERMKKLMKR
jgi:uncharacterized protein (UPF0332 family)/predicted nucleotidyltransferase